MNAELHLVRDEIRKTDEDLVRDLAVGGAAVAVRWEERPVVKRRIELGVKVAECKFHHDPDRFRALARVRDTSGLERAITDARMEEAVLDRVRKQVGELGCTPVIASAVAEFYRTWIIPETKKIQIQRLCEMG